MLLLLYDLEKFFQGFFASFFQNNKKKKELIHSKMKSVFQHSMKIIFDKIFIEEIAKRIDFFLLPKIMGTCLALQGFAKPCKL